MKKAFLLMMLVAGVSVAGAHARAHGYGGVSFGVFYSSLSPHGEWILISPDVYAWRPLRVAAGWRPYTFGRWVWTDDGWFWLSDEPWGWAAYHYGRWYYDDFYGWMWIPGYEWAPAWVEWRYGGDYIGWAPLGPYAVFSVSFGIYYTTRWTTPYYWWSFVDCHYVTHTHVHNYIHRISNNTRYIGRTRSAGSVRYTGGRVVTRGPDREYVERRGSIQIERARLVDATERENARLIEDTGQRRIEAYRPVIEDRSGGDEVVRPQDFKRAERDVNIDARKIDLRSRELNNADGRDLRRAEEYRSRQEEGQRRSQERPAVRDRNTERSPRTTEERDVTRERRQNEPAQERRVDGAERKRPEGQVDRGSERRKESVERQPERREQTRSPNPERTIRRSEPRRDERRSDPAPPPQERKGRGR